MALPLKRTYETRDAERNRGNLLPVVATENHTLSDHSHHFLSRCGMKVVAGLLRSDLAEEAASASELVGARTLPSRTAA